jgi:hypothetical protein
MFREYIMGYSNRQANKNSTINSIDNLNNGGNKKAGFPYHVGRESWTSIFFQSTGKNCCTQSGYMHMRHHQKNVSPLAGLKFTSSMGVDHR